MKPTAAIALLVLLGVACSDAASPNPGSIPPNTSPLPTIVATDYEAEWEPAWDPSTADRSNLESALARAAVWMLVPATPAPGEVEPLSASVRLSSTMPSTVAGIDIVIRRADLSVVMSVQARPVVGAPICEPLVATGGEWSVRTVRGRPGCSLPVADAVSFFAWTESGQNFFAQHGPETDTASLVTWLDSWAPVGSA